MTKDGQPAILPTRIVLVAVYTLQRTLAWAVAWIVGIPAVLLILGLARRRVPALNRAYEFVIRGVHATVRMSDEFAKSRRPWTNIGPSRYWAWAVFFIALYGVVWGTQWRYIYGWMWDDWGTYLKALATLKDPKAAFIIRANLLQPYFYFFSYVPLALGLRVPSVDIPTFGASTGQWRFFILYTVSYHLFIAACWAWLARKLCRQESAALLSLVFLLTSPTFVFWTAQTDTRLVGLPFVLIGIWLLMRPPAPTPSRAFWAGFLFLFAHNLHYTAMYLLVPASMVLCGVDFLARWNRKEFWKTWALFAAGAGSVVVTLELLSHYWVGQPFSGGPLRLSFSQGQYHASEITRWQNLNLWAHFGLNQLGFAMILMSAAGVWLYVRPGDFSGLDRVGRVSVVLFCALGLIIVLLALRRNLMNRKQA